MDISETFRPEDITKTDFFDFVVAPDVADNGGLPQFNRSMKSIGIFLESYNNNNNEDPSSERKETNNNHLVLGNGPVDGATQPPAFTETQFWSSSTNCEKDTVRWEPSMLEDLNCWNQGGQGNNSSTSKALTDAENTDGAIYTLTVLNSGEQSTWYRAPDAPEEDKNCSQSTTSTTLSSHQSSMDLDTFLDSIPSSVAKSLTETTSFHNGYPRTSTELTTTTVASNDAPLPATIKREFAYNDSGFSDTKEELCNNMVTDISLGNNPTGGQPFNNNNDWKITDNNNDSQSSGGMDSLLRNALQGKAFLTRYNGSHAIKTEKAEEMRRVLGSPPSTKPSSETSFSTELDEDIKTRSPLMAVSIEGGTVVMFDGGGGGGTMLIDSDNPSSAQSMDDIFLSQLDAVSYPEDYEKLKRIENEVAESVEQYCNLDTSGHNIYIPTHLSDGSRLQQVGNLDSVLINAIPSTTSKNNKKYAKRSSCSSSSKSPHQLQSSGSSSGVRKERSLHYCNICSKGFKDKYSVNVHIRTHTGEKPFSCSLCGKSFRQKAHLAKHYHTHLAQAKNAASGSQTKSPANKSAR